MAQTTSLSSELNGTPFAVSDEELAPEVVQQLLNKNISTYLLAMARHNEKRAVEFFVHRDRSTKDISENWPDNFTDDWPEISMEKRKRAAQQLQQRVFEFLQDYPVREVGRVFKFRFTVVSDQRDDDDNFVAPESEDSPLGIATMDGDNGIMQSSVLRATGRLPKLDSLSIDNGLVVTAQAVGKDFPQVFQHQLVDSGDDTNVFANRQSDRNPGYDEANPFDRLTTTRNLQQELVEEAQTNANITRGIYLRSLLREAEEDAVEPGTLSPDFLAGPMAVDLMGSPSEKAAAEEALFGSAGPGAMGAAAASRQVRVSSAAPLAAVALAPSASDGFTTVRAALPGEIGAPRIELPRAPVLATNSAGSANPQGVATPTSGVAAVAVAGTAVAASIPVATRSGSSLYATAPQVIASSQTVAPSSGVRPVQTAAVTGGTTATGTDGRTNEVAVFTPPLLSQPYRPVPANSDLEEAQERTAERFAASDTVGEGTAQTAVPEVPVGEIAAPLANAPYWPVPPDSDLDRIEERQAAQYAATNTVAETAPEVEPAEPASQVAFEQSAVRDYAPTYIEAQGGTPDASTTFLPTTATEAEPGSMVDQPAPATNFVAATYEPTRSPTSTGFFSSANNSFVTGFNSDFTQDTASGGPSRVAASDDDVMQRTANIPPVAPSGLSTGRVDVTSADEDVSHASNTATQVASNALGGTELTPPAAHHDDFNSLRAVTMHYVLTQDGATPQLANFDDISGIQTRQDLASQEITEPSSDLDTQDLSQRPAPVATASLDDTLESAAPVAVAGVAATEMEEQPPQKAAETEEPSVLQKAALAEAKIVGGPMGALMAAVVEKEGKKPLRAQGIEIPAAKAKAEPRRRVARKVKEPKELHPQRPKEVVQHALLEGHLEEETPG